MGYKISDKSHDSIKEQLRDAIMEADSQCSRLAMKGVTSKRLMRFNKTVKQYQIGRLAEWN